MPGPFTASGATTQSAQGSSALGVLESLGTGLAIVIDAGGFVMKSCEAVLIAAPGTELNLGPALRLTPVGIFHDGLVAVYRETSSQFADGGEWMLQLEILTATGDIYTSPPSQVRFPTTLIPLEN